MIPKTNFIWTSDTEALRIAHVCGNISMGFFQQEKIAVLPYLPRPECGVVVLPELYFGEIDHFWPDVIKHMDILYPKLDDEMTFNLKKLAGSVVDVDLACLSEKENLWREKEKDFYEIINVIFPQTQRMINEIEIRLTNFGPNVSWSIPQGKYDQNQIIFLRKDVPIDHIAEAIVTVVNRSPGWEDKFTWRESEQFVDNLMTETSLRDLFPNFVPTLQSFDQDYKEFESESKKYLKKLGFPVKDKKMVVKNELVTYEGKNISKQLSHRENCLLVIFLENTNKVLDYDQLSEILWKDEEQFSLWAMNKAIGRLRQKLAKLGIRKDHLKPVYGEGYIWVEN